MSEIDTEWTHEKKKHSKIYDWRKVLESLWDIPCDQHVFDEPIFHQKNEAPCDIIRLSSASHEVVNACGMLAHKFRFFYQVHKPEARHVDIKWVFSILSDWNLQPSTWKTDRKRNIMLSTGHGKMKVLLDIYHERARNT